MNEDVEPALDLDAENAELALGPLTGIRVIDVTLAVQGPHASAYLADMGADVVRVEPPGGELNRYVRTPGYQHALNVLGTQHVAMNRGKRALSVDVHSDVGREVIDRLIDGADVLVTNYRQEALERMGLGFERVANRNEKLIYARVSGFGSQGPDADKAMLDGAAQARSGLSLMTGPTDGPPCPPGSAVADHAGSMQLALGVMTALYARTRTGRGQQVNTSSLGAMMWLQAWELANAGMAEEATARSGAHHPLIPCPYGVYETADGGWFLLAVARADESWDAFWTFAGRPETVLDARWNTAAKRIGARGSDDGVEEIRELTREAFASRTTAEWNEFLATQPQIIFERLQTYEEVLNDPMVEANGYLADVDVQGFGPARVVSNVVQLSDTPGIGVQGPAPQLGEHTAEVMRELGFSIDQIAEVTSTHHPASCEVMALVEGD